MELSLYIPRPCRRRRPPPPRYAPARGPIRRRQRVGEGERQAADARGGGAHRREGNHGTEPSPSPDSIRHLQLRLRRRSPPSRPRLSARHARGGPRRRARCPCCRSRRRGSPRRREGRVRPPRRGSVAASLHRLLPSHGHQDDDVARVNKRTHARFLVTHAEAGLIIGTGGSAVSAIEARSGARVKLSRHDELLPGTDRRVVLVSGLLSQVMDAMELMLERLLYQGDQVSDSEATLVLVVPQPCCGVLIGKGGSVIKSFTEASETAIQISPQNISYGFNDRLVTITGPLDNRLRAVFLIIFELLEDVRYLFPYVAAKPNTRMSSPVNKDAQESLTIAVADEYMGAVIGRGGRSINEISKVSGAWIEISGKGEFIPGTRDREVTMSGTSEAIRAAEAMIMHRVSMASGKGGNFTGGRSGKGLLSRLDEEEDAAVQMRQLNLRDECDIVVADLGQSRD